MDANVDTETRADVRRFLLREAELLDDRRFQEWLDCLTSDVEYRIPVRVTREAESDAAFIDMAHIDDDKYRLDKRVERLQTHYAWAEDPPTRTRHFVSNIRVTATDTDGELTAKSNVLVSILRGDDPDPRFLSGERVDRLRRVDGDLLLADRRVELDHTTLPVASLSIFI